MDLGPHDDGIAATMAGRVRAERMPELSAQDRTLVMGIRQVLIMALGLLEDWMGMERSITPKSKRQA